MTDSTEPVDLDPPAPLPAEILRWVELAGRDIDIDHAGDASKVIPFPRPAWADPDNDFVGTTVQGSYYRSAAAEVPSLSAGGEEDGETLSPAFVKVSVRVHGTGNQLVGLSLFKFSEKQDQWVQAGMSLPPAAAADLAHVLLAAVDLIGGAK